MNLGTLLWGIALGALFLGWVRWMDRNRQHQFQLQFPPIDEDEFLRRCGPGVNAAIALRVRRIISEQLNVEYERVYPEHRLVEDLGCD